MRVSLFGGQQQRLCIGRTIAVKPQIVLMDEVFLMDEVCLALDPIATARIEELIVKLQHDFTILIVTHTHNMRVSDRNPFFYLGELIEYTNHFKIFGNPSKERNPYSILSSSQEVLSLSLT